MRKIRFRGVLEGDPGRTFVYGDLIDDSTSEEEYHIIRFQEDDFRVKSQTVGEYTGIHDAKRTPIYEGDLLRLNKTDQGVVEWRRGGFVVRVSPSVIVFPLTPFNSYTVDGNIHFGKDNEKRGGAR